MPIAWFREGDWRRWQVVDSQLPGYAAWLSKIEEAIKGLEQRGHSVAKVIVDPDEFLAWCQANRRHIDRDARNAYAAVLLSQYRRDHY